ncbi:MAG: hydrogenase maturation nickel metallochaperone HypA [Acidobacteriaceae bacterium]
MHEIGIAAAIIEAGQVEAAGRPGAKLVRIGVRIGVLSGVDKDALQFAVSALVAGTDLEALILEIQYCQRRNKCAKCSHEFETAMYSAACPLCRNEDTILVGGDELEVVCVELEEA